MHGLPIDPALGRTAALLFTTTSLRVFYRPPGFHSLLKLPRPETCGEKSNAAGRDHVLRVSNQRL